MCNNPDNVQITNDHELQEGRRLDMTSSSTAASDGVAFHLCLSVRCAVGSEVKGHGSCAPCVSHVGGPRSPIPRGGCVTMAFPMNGFIF